MSAGVGFAANELAGLIVRAAASTHVPNFSPAIAVPFLTFEAPVNYN